MQPTTQVRTPYLKKTSMIYDSDMSNTEIYQYEIFSKINFSCIKETKNAILPTPECDLVIQNMRQKPKAVYLKFAAIIDFKFLLDNFLSQLKITKRQRQGLEQIPNSTFEDLKLLIKQFLNGNIYPRYYFLPALESFYAHSVIDFQLLEIMEFNVRIKVELIKNKIARIKSSWKESIPVEYASYSSRIGVTDISDSVMDQVLRDYRLNFIYGHD